MKTKAYYLVIDFEANCTGNLIKDHEIIEFPAVLVNAQDGLIVAEFRQFVKLVKHKQLSEFIKELTKITDEQVNGGLEWKTCLEEFEKWCREKNIDIGNTTVVTCGDWDLRTMLPKQLKSTKTELSVYLTELLGCWCNAKISFMNCFGNDKQIGMDRMLEKLNLQLEGHHHSGIDDCRNIAKICHKLMGLGFDVTHPNRVREKKLWYKTDKVPYKKTNAGEIIKK
jgi:inhibitor of KinA sporulation pathway (predicted exonuclease)